MKKEAAIIFAAAAGILAIASYAYALGIGEILTYKQTFKFNLTGSTYLVDTSAHRPPTAVPLGFRNKGNADINVALKLGGDIKNIANLSAFNFTMKPNETRYIHFKICISQSKLYRGLVTVSFTHPGQAGFSNIDMEVNADASGPVTNIVPCDMKFPPPNSSGDNLTDLYSKLEKAQQEYDTLLARARSLENRTNYLESFVSIITGNINNIMGAICSVHEFSICPGGGSCTDECATGSRICSSSASYKVCGNFDSDSCLEYGTATACPSGQTCSNGLCSSGGSCLSTGSSCAANSQCCSQSCQLVQACESKSCKGIASQTSCVSKKGCQWYSSFFIQECRGTYQSCTTSGPKCQ